MGVEVLALSLPSPTSQWERLSSSHQASTQGVTEMVNVEIRPSNFTYQGRPSIRVPRLKCMPQRSVQYFGPQIEASKRSCNPKRFRVSRSSSRWLEPPSLVSMEPIEKHNFLPRALATSEIKDIASAPVVSKEKVGVLLLNLGGPETLQDVQPFLFNLFADPDIIRLPRLFRFLQKPLAQFISVLRAPKSKEGYASIGGGSPLRRITDEQAEELRKSLCAKDIPAKVYVGMRYWHPFTEEAIEQIKRDGITMLVVLPLYPQFSISTSGSSLRLLESIFREDEYLVNMQHTVIPSWYQREGYIKAMVNLTEKELEKFQSPEKVTIFFSAHGVPLAYVEEAGDPYKAEMEQCVDLIMEELEKRGKLNPYTLAYQVAGVFNLDSIHHQQNLGLISCHCKSLNCRWYLREKIISPFYDLIFNLSESKMNGDLLVFNCFLELLLADDVAAG